MSAISRFTKVDFAKSVRPVQGTCAALAGLILWANPLLASITTPFELRVTWGICGTGTFADGMLTASEHDLSATLRFADGERASFSTTPGGNGSFEAKFQIGSGDGIQIEGQVKGSTGQGRWKSATLSCGGEWQTRQGR